MIRYLVDRAGNFVTRMVNGVLTFITEEVDDVTGESEIDLEGRCCCPCESGSGYTDDGETIRSDDWTTTGAAPGLGSSVLYWDDEGYLINTLQDTPVSRVSFHAISVEDQTDVYAAVFLKGQPIKCKFYSNTGGMQIVVLGAVKATASGIPIDEGDVLEQASACFDRATGVIRMDRVGSQSHAVYYKLTQEDLVALNEWGVDFTDDDDYDWQSDGLFGFGVFSVENSENPAVVVYPVTWSAGHCPQCPVSNKPDHPGGGGGCCVGLGDSVATLTLTGLEDTEFPAEYVIDDCTFDETIECEGFSVNLNAGLGGDLCTYKGLLRINGVLVPGVVGGPECVWLIFVHLYYFNADPGSDDDPCPSTPCWSRHRYTASYTTDAETMPDTPATPAPSEGFDRDWICDFAPEFTEHWPNPGKPCGGDGLEISIGVAPPE